MGLRRTNTNEGASDRCRGINNLDRAFIRVKLAVGQSVRGQSSTDGRPKYGTNSKEKPGSPTGFVIRERLSRWRKTTALRRRTA